MPALDPQLYPTRVYLQMIRLKKKSNRVLMYQMPSFKRVLFALQAPLRVDPPARDRSAPLIYPIKNIHLSPATLRQFSGCPYCGEKDKIAHHIACWKWER